MPVALDLDMEVGAKYAAEAIPYTVVIDAEGAVTYVTMGADPQGATKLTQAVQSALSE